MKIVDPADPAVELEGSLLLKGKGHVVLIRRGGHNDGRMLMTRLVNGLPLADEPCVDSLGRSGGRVVVETAGEQYANTENWQGTEQVLHGNGRGSVLKNLTMGFEIRVTASTINHQDR
jgi:hypothetical protein